MVRTTSGSPAGGAKSTPSHCPSFSVVVPTLDEATHLAALLGDLRALVDDAGTNNEILVVDGGSDDDTVGIAERAGARLVRAPRGRGRQLRAGADAARGEWLWFLHADVRATPMLLALVLDQVEANDARVASWCPLRIDAPGLRYRIVEAGANARSRWLGLPYGDQGLLVHRRHYDAAGGFDDVPLMEDVALVRRLAAHGRLSGLAVPLIVSARRWERDGVLRRTLRNWGILLRWLLGASPETLARRYE